MNVHEQVRQKLEVVSKSHARRFCERVGPEDDHHRVKEYFADLMLAHPSITISARSALMYAGVGEIVDVLEAFVFPILTRLPTGETK